VNYLATLLLTSSLLLSAACQHAMSVGQAKSVATSFQHLGLVPPPRTIQDITAILDEQKAENPVALAEARSGLAASPLADANPIELHDFFYRRGVLAARLGANRQAIADLEESLRYARQARLPEHRLLAQIGWAEAQGGNETRAFGHSREPIRVAPKKDVGWLYSLYASLVWHAARIGDLKSADAAMRELSNLEMKSRAGQSGAERWRALGRGLVANSRGALHVARGQFSEGETAYREAVAAMASRSDLEQSHDGELFRARLGSVLLLQGRPREAEREVRTALLSALRRNGRYSVETAVILQYLAYVLNGQRRHAEAESLARAGIEIFDKIGVAHASVLPALNRAHLATALAGQGRWGAVVQEFEAIREHLSDDAETFSAHFGARSVWGLALLQVDRHAEAMVILTRALEYSRAARGDDHPTTLSVRGLLAVGRYGLGDRGGALREFAGVTKAILADRSERHGDEEEGAGSSIQALELILTHYMRLLAEIRGTALEREMGFDAAAEAYRIADMARGQEVQRALNAAAVRASIRDPMLAALVRQEQDARKQVTALEGALAKLLSAPVERPNREMIATLRVDVDRLRSARRTLTAQIQKDFPGYAQLINPSPVTAEQTRRALRSGEALISTFVWSQGVFVWAIPKSGPIAFATTSGGMEQLRKDVAHLREALDPSAKTLAEIPAFDLATAYTLYQQVLAPVRDGWLKADSLLVVADGPLAYLPFGFLVTKPVGLSPETSSIFSNYRDVPWLIRSHAVTVLPSITSLVALRTLPQSDRTRRPFLGFGDPWFSEEQARRARRLNEQAEVAALLEGVGTRGMPIALRNPPKTLTAATAQLAMLPRLPETAVEIRSIAVAMNANLSRDVFTGARATEKAVKSVRLSDYRVIAFATHGLSPGELDGLSQPALALSAPEVADSDDDGLLTMEEILSLRLDADWIVLSACNTGSAEGTGSEAISGLGRAFFYAGARSLLVSNWPVETTSAKALIIELFRRQAGDPSLSRARALQETMNWLIDHGQLMDSDTEKIAFSYAHPIFWAPFSLIGDGGR
jgi:CHAT domain-containing protein